MFDPLTIYMIELKDKTVTIPLGAALWHEVVDLSEIRIPDNYCGMDAAQVEKYAGYLHDGYTLEPVFLYWNNEENFHWLIDGRHRFVATMIVGKKTINAFITDSIAMVA